MTMTRTVFLRSLLLVLASIALVTGLKAQSRPVSPSGLVVTNVTGTTVTLQWQPGSAVQGYVLEAGDDAGLVECRALLHRKPGAHRRRERTSRRGRFTSACGA